MRNGLVTAIGAIVAVAALPEFTGSALAADPDNYMQIITTANFSNYHCQSNWWYCIKCSGSYHSGNNTAGGVCPAGGEHQNNTSYTKYCLPHDGAALPTDSIGDGVQAGWRWCAKCQGLFWGSAQAESTCPAGGHHAITSGTYTYDLAYGQPELWLIINGGGSTQITGQTDWLYCGKCRGLFYGHGGTADGVCPAGGTHSQYSGSSNYIMIPYFSESSV